MIRFACECGRQLQAKDEDIGKKAKCPSCGSIVNVAVGDDAEPPRPKAPARELDKDRLDHEDRDEGREDRVRPDRRSRADEDSADRPRRRRDRADRDDREDDEVPRKKRRPRQDPAYDEPQKTSGKATAALIFGIASVCLVIPAIPGIIFGCLALRDISKSDGQLGGKGTAIAGIIFSCVSFLLLMPIAIFAALLVPAVGNVRSAASRVADGNNLKQITLAMHNFDSAYGKFPQATAYRDATGKPLLSWRVALLPFINEDGLYRRFKLDEPWDGPTNKPLIPLMPRVYAVPNDTNLPTTGLTRYQVFVGPGSMFEPRKGGPIAPLSVQMGWGMNEITDGTANTLMVATARDPVIWTKPDDLVFDPLGPPPALGGPSSAGFNIAYMDGSVRYVTPQQLSDPALLRALITRNGGEVVSPP